MSDAIHQWFSLSRDAYLVMPRLALQEMPDEWQAKMVALLEEATAAGLTTPEYLVLRADEKFTYVEPYDENDLSSRDYRFTALFEDPWANYRRGRVRDLCPEFKPACPLSTPIPKPTRTG